MSVSEWFGRSKKLLNRYGEAVVETVTDAVVVVGRTGEVAHANDAFFRLFPGERRHVIGRKVADLAKAWGMPDVLALLAEAGATGCASRRLRCPSDGGLLLHCEARRVAHGGFVLNLHREADEADPGDAGLMTRELSHRVKNSLQLISAFVASESRRGAADGDGLAIVGSQICAIGVLYDVMARAGSGEMVRGDLLLEEMATALRGSILQHRPELSLSVEAEPLQLPPDRAEPLALIVNELATNAVKHAFAGRAGRIVIGLRRHGESLVLTVADDGVGMEGAQERGLGSRFVRAFVAQLGGVMSCDTGPNGSRHEIRAPLARSGFSGSDASGFEARQVSRYAGER
jgi:two-component sensor histidine kinase